MLKDSLNTQIGGDHYKTKKIQPWEYIEANSLDFWEGNVVKYITRWKSKGGVEDLEKIKHYVDYLIERENARQKQLKYTHYLDTICYFAPTSDEWREWLRPSSILTRERKDYTLAWRDNLSTYRDTIADPRGLGRTSKEQVRYDFEEGNCCSECSGDD